jgi:ABC-type transport system substrate-binding protein
MGWAHTGFWRSSPTSSDFLPDASQLWNVWHDTNGAEGEEPEPWAKRLYEIADLADSYRMSEERVTELHNEMFEILKEQVPTVMPVDETVQLLLMADNLSNVPPEGYVTLSSMVQEQWYYQS